MASTGTPDVAGEPQGAPPRVAPWRGGPMLEPVKAPWIDPGVVLHGPETSVEDLLLDFAADLRARGFSVAGGLPRAEPAGDDRGKGCPRTAGLFDLRTGQTIALEPDPTGQAVVSASTALLRRAFRDDVDLVVLGRYPVLLRAAERLKAMVGGRPQGVPMGMPVLTSVAGPCAHKWLEGAAPAGLLLPPEKSALWRWWGPERLYRDLILGVAEDEVRQIAAGPRWLMVEGPHGAGVAFLSKGMKGLAARLPQLRRQSLRQLAERAGSWDEADMAIGMAAINAHYNRYDLTGQMGNGAHLLGNQDGDVVVVGAFPGMREMLPRCTVIEPDPRPGEFPSVAMDTLLPRCAAAVVASSALVERHLPRVLRLCQGARVALVGPVTPMTPRLHSYGVEILGGLLVRDPAGLGRAIRAGALPREFSRFGYFLHLRRRDAAVPVPEFDKETP